MSPNVKCGLWVMVMFQFGFSDSNTCATLVEVLIVGEAVCVKGARGIREISLLCSILL